MIKFDETNKRIMRQLQKNNKITNSTLAEIVNLSAPACLKRVNYLHEIGVIEKNVAILNSNLIGEGIVIIVEIEIERGKSFHKTNEGFIENIKNSPEVTQCYQIAGEIDFLLIVNVPNFLMFEAFSNRVLYGEPNIRRFKTLISMARNKFKTEIEF